MNPQQPQQQQGIVAMMNQRGISSWEEGKDGEALQYFNQAMAIVSPAFSAGGCIITNHNKLLWKAFNLSKPDAEHATCSLSSLPDHTTTTTTTTDSSCSSFSSQASGGDEEEEDKYYLMSVWQEDMIDITTTNPYQQSPAILSATILCNMALVYSQNHDYPQMKHCLERAFQMLLLMNPTATSSDNDGQQQGLQQHQKTKTTATSTDHHPGGSTNNTSLLGLVLHIQHNLGYSCYKMSQFEEALKYYRFPLLLASNNSNDEPMAFHNTMDRAMCFNCQAITYANMGQPIRAVELLSHAISLAAAAGATNKRGSGGRGGGGGAGKKTQTVSLILKNMSILCSEDFLYRDYNASVVARPTSHTASQRDGASTTPSVVAAAAVAYENGNTTRSLHRSGDPIVGGPLQTQASLLPGVGSVGSSHHTTLPVTTSPAAPWTLFLCDQQDNQSSSSSSSSPTTALHALEGALQSVYNLFVQQRQQRPEGGGGERKLESSDLVSALQSCGDMCSHLNQHDRAVQFYRDAISVHHQHYDPQDQRNHNQRMAATATTDSIGTSLKMRLLRSLSDMHQASRDYPSTMTYLKQLYDAQCNLYGPDSLIVGSSVARLGWVQFLLGNHSSALNFYEEALRVWLLLEERVGSSSSSSNNSDGEEEKPKLEDIEYALNLMGLLYLQLKKYGKAKTAFLKCLSRIHMHQQHPPSAENRAVATLQYNLATADMARGREEEGLAMLEQSLESDRRVLGRHHPELIKTLQFLGERYERLGMYENSLEFYQQALDIARIVLISNPHLDGASRLTPFALHNLRTVCKLLNLMGNVHLAKADLSSMMRNLVDATRLAELMRCSSQIPAADAPMVQIFGLQDYIIHRMFPPCAEAA